MTELKPYTILNGKYRIETVVVQKDDEIIYKATDLVMREEVIIHEFFPRDLVDRLTDNDELIIKNNTQNKFFDKLSEFENDIAKKAQDASEEIVKNYFRENNTGYLVVTENRKLLRKRRNIARIVLGVLIAGVVIEAGLLLFSSEKKANKSANDTVDNIEQLIAEETLNTDDVDKLVENTDEETEVQEERKQYSEEELLAMIKEKSGEVLWGSYDTEDNKNIIQRLQDDIGSEYMSWSPGESENFRALWYEDFNGDGHKEMAALMCNFDITMFKPELWFSDGNTVEQIVIPAKEYDRSCWGLFLVQFGKQKIVQLVYGDNWYSNLIDSSYQYAYEEGTLINVTVPNSVFFFQNDKDMNVVAQKMSGGETLYLHNNAFGFGDDIDSEFFDSLFGTHTVIADSYSGACSNDYFVYYKDKTFHEFSSLEIDANEATEKYVNFEECRIEIEDAFKDMVFSHAPGYDDSNCIFKSLKLKSIYISEYNKLFLNYVIEGVWTSGGEIMEGHEDKFDISICYSINDDNRLEIYSAYAGTREVGSGLFD